jgi:hypothetical protein
VEWPDSWNSNRGPLPPPAQDGSGTIDFEEFLQMMTSKMGERDSNEEIMKAFKLFDDDNTGFITLKNLKRVAKELGENLTDEELQVGSTLNWGRNVGLLAPGQTLVNCVNPLS